MRRERLVSLPSRPAAIRLGTPAESAAQPAPHLSPPRLIGNQGEPAEFVLPLENPNARPGSVRPSTMRGPLSVIARSLEADGFGALPSRSSVARNDTRSFA